MDALVAFDNLLTCPLAQNEINGRPQLCVGLSGLVTHFNNDHRWSREQFADWLEALGFRAPGAGAVAHGRAKNLGHARCLDGDPVAFEGGVADAIPRVNRTREQRYAAAKSALGISADPRLPGLTRCVIPAGARADRGVGRGARVPSPDLTRPGTRCYAALHP
jgi:hypothetical protein